MSSRNFVREIKAEDVKGINPKDIVYLAMKDGSILLITDNDENIINFEDMDSIIKRKNNRNYNYEKYNNNKYQIKSNSSNSRDNNNTPSTYSNYSKDRTKTSSYSSREKDQNKSKAIISNRSQNERNYKANDISNKNSNISRTNYTSEVYKISPNLNNKIKSARLGTTSNTSNISHKRTYVINENNNNNNNNNNQSNSSNSRVIQRNKSTKNYFISNTQNNDKNDEKFKNNFHSNFASPIQNKYNNNFVYNSKRKNNLNDKNNNISDRDNKNIPIRKFEINYSKENNSYKYNKDYNKDDQIRNNSISINKTSISKYISPPKNCDNKKEVEISGKFVICDDMNKFIEHGYSFNLFKNDYSLCDNLVKNTKLNLSSIKEDEFGKHGFVAIFGKCNGKKENS